MSWVTNRPGHMYLKDTDITIKWFEPENRLPQPGHKGFSLLYRGKLFRPCDTLSEAKQAGETLHSDLMAMDIHPHDVRMRDAVVDVLSRHESAAF